VLFLRRTDQIRATCTASNIRPRHALGSWSNPRESRTPHRSRFAVLAITTTPRTPLARFDYQDDPPAASFDHSIELSRNLNCAAAKLWRRPGICASRVPGSGSRSHKQCSEIAILSGTRLPTSRSRWTRHALHPLPLRVLAAAITAVIVSFLFKFHLQNNRMPSVLPSTEIRGWRPREYRPRDSGDGHVRLGLRSSMLISTHAPGHAGCLRDRHAVDVEGAAAPGIKEINELHRYRGAAMSGGP